MVAGLDFDIRPATPADAAQILAIYTPYVTNTAISFEETPPSLGEMQGRISDYAARYGYYVAERGGQILGYAYGSPYRPRHAYRFTAEVSVYLAPTAQGQGIGRALYDVLITGLQTRGFHALIGIVTLPNPACAALHRALGFTEIGVTPQVGRKFDRWHDIAIFQRVLGL